ncbi:GNAT family N-acetyltransferase [Bradyrhizobium sp. HKCCYLS1011]|uniref:GNAT family N-acetyltransferase n=1 Tax=Bradyrhizobium sp. HKCCYLS1011 TaxID=3420733 RepID=UPI003EBF3464
MNLDVREMALDETGIVIDYFHSSTPEHLEMMGVDPTRMPSRAIWAGRFKELYAQPIAERTNFLVLWQLDGNPVGFSSCDKIVFGNRANMHLHVTEPELRQQGIGAECVRRSVDIYFRTFELKQLFCEPNAFNVGPNRTLQKAGFRYLKTYKTVPGYLNYHQAVTRWVIER